MSTDDTATPSPSPGENGGDVPAAPPGRRGTLIRAVVIVGVLVLVFGVILPQAIDYQAVVEAFKRLDAVQIAVMTTLGVIAWVVAGSAITVVMEGLTLLRGTTSWIVLSGIGSSIPFGPWNLGVLWVVVRDWDVTNREATSGIAVYGIVNVLSYLFLPLAAATFLTVSGGFTDTGNPAVVWLISIVIGAIALAIFGLLVGIARSERIADWVARTGQRIADAIVRRLGRTSVPNVKTAVSNFSDQLGTVVRRRGLAAMALAVISQIVWVVVLVAALRMVGVSEASLPASWVLAAAAIVAVVNIIPISPGGAGVPELMFIGLLTAMAPDVSSADIAAGIFLYRLYFWFLPIPLSWIALKLVRRGKSMLPSGSELRSYAAADAAAE